VIPLGAEDRLRVFPFAVYAIVTLNLYVFFGMELQAPDADAFINAFAAIPYDVTHGVVLAPPSPPSPLLTLITSQFLHGGLLHIASNMLFLFVFGPGIEYMTGTLRFVLFYLLCGTIAALAQVAVMPASHVPSIGASGAIAGVLGAYLVSYPKATMRTVVPIGCFPLLLRLPAVLVIGLWIFTQLVHGYGAISGKVLSEQGGGIAYFAHIGGFAAGLLLIRWFTIRTPRLRRSGFYA
jgi:membrane associated rhomboid family serine protease